MIFLTIGDLVSPSGSVYGDPMIFPIIGNLVSIALRPLRTSAGAERSALYELKICPLSAARESQPLSRGVYRVARATGCLPLRGARQLTMLRPVVQPSFSGVPRLVRHSALFRLESSPRHPFPVRRCVADTAHTLGERSLLPMVLCVQT